MSCFCRLSSHPSLTPAVFRLEDTEPVAVDLYIDLRMRAHVSHPQSLHAFRCSCQYTVSWSAYNVHVSPLITATAGSDRQVAPVSVGFNVGNPALSSFPGSAGVAQQAPCVAYQGLRSAVSGNANARRVDAYLRHRTSSSANMPRTRTTALARAGGGPAGPSANPFAHASTPLPQNAPTTSIMTSASSSASLPSASSPSTPIDLCVVLIPHVVRSLFLTP